MTVIIHQTTDAEIDVLRGRNLEPARYFSVVPADELFSGTLESWNVYTGNGSIYGLNVQGVDNSTPQARSGMLVDVGTTPGAHDIARLRVREASTGITDQRTIPINLTSAGELPLVLGQFVTVREDFRPFQIDFLLEPIYDVDGTIIGINEYMDFDNAFGAPNTRVEPKANIVSSYQLDDDTGEVFIALLKPAEWEDFVGAGLRTVTLSALASVCMRPGGALDDVLWEVRDGTITVGTDEDWEITVEFPVGFRYITLHVYDGDSESVMEFPIWCHDASYMPFVLFNISNDVTENWREMTLDCFGNPGEADETVIPEGAGGCYWETPGWLAGAQPEDYRDHAMGWVTEDTSNLSVPNDGFTLKLAGLGWWLDHFQGGSQAMFDPHGTPATWFHLQHLGLKEATGFALRHYSTAWKIANIFWTDEVPQTTDRVTIEAGTIFEQINAVAAHFSMSVANCDSFGNFWVERSFQHRSKYNRITVNPLLNAGAQDLMDEGMPLTVRQSPNYAQIEAAGSIYQAGAYTLFASLAPGKTKSAGNSFAKLPGQYLASTSPQFDLDALSGMHWAFLNNEYVPTDAPLMDNYDTVEPAWERPISLSFTEETVHGRTLVNALYMVRRVTIEHNFDFAENRDSEDNANPAKKITWTLERVTLGASGVSIPVVQDEGVEPPEETPPQENVPPWIPNSVPAKITLYSGEGPRVAMMVSYALNEDEDAYLCDYIDKSGNLAALGVTNIVWCYSHPHHYRRARAYTDIGLVFCDDIDADSPVWYLKWDNDDLFDGNYGHQCFASHMVEGWGMIVCGSGGYTVTFDDWETFQQGTVGGGVAGIPNFATSYHHEGAFQNTSIWLCGHNANHLYGIASFDTLWRALYHSDDGGLTWEFVEITDIEIDGLLEDGMVRVNQGQVTVSIPYSKPGGAPNTLPNLMIELIVQHQSYPQGSITGAWRIRSMNGGSTFSDANDPPVIFTSRGRLCNPVHSFTQDSRFQFIPAFANDSELDGAIGCWVTDDNGATSLFTPNLAVFNDNTDNRALTGNGWVDPRVFILFDGNPNDGHGNPRLYLCLNGVDILPCNLPISLGWSPTESVCYAQGELFTIDGMPQ